MDLPHYTFHPAQALMQPASAQAFRFAFVEGRLLLPEVEQPQLHFDTEHFEPMALANHYLGRLDGHDCWALRLSEVPAGWQAMSLRAAMMSMPPALSLLAGRAAQIAEWDRSHRFCGVCGSPTELKAGERARQCLSCGHLAYPRISPAMMALVRRGDALLLARSPNFTPGIFSALAGFVEAGESLEECVRREVKEEVGVEVGNLRYWGSQSHPFPHSLMLAFVCDWQDGDIVPQAGEIEEAGWFHIDALPGIPPNFSIAGRLIRAVVEEMRQQRTAC